MFSVFLLVSFRVWGSPSWPIPKQRPTLALEPSKKAALSARTWRGRQHRHDMHGEFQWKLADEGLMIYWWCIVCSYERRLLFKLIWKAAFVWVTPYLVQLTFSLEACSWKNGDLVFQRWSFFSTLETCMGIDDPYVKKPRWRRNWNAISKMIKDGLVVTRKLCVEVLDLVLTSFQTSFFSGHHE